MQYPILLAHKWSVAAWTIIILSGCTDGEYMVNFSGRYRELHGVTVRTDTPEHFMDDLKKYGYIKG